MTATSPTFFAVQDEIHERVVAAIEPELYAAEQVRSQSKRPDSLDAWECVIRALSCIGQGTRDENAEAEALCRRAIVIAPRLRPSAQPAGLDTVAPYYVVGRLANGGARNQRGDADRIRPRRLRPPGHTLPRACCKCDLRRFGEAVRALRRALELNPNFALAHALLAHVLSLQGAPQEAVDSAEHALRLSPRDRLVGTYASLAMANVHFAAGRHSECVTWGAQHDREKSRIPPGTFPSDRGAGDGGGIWPRRRRRGARSFASDRNSR